MALTVTKLSQTDHGLEETVSAELAFDASYPVGGEALTAADLGFRVGNRLDQVLMAPLGGLAFDYVPDATLPDRGKIRVMGRAGDDFLLNMANLAIGVGDAAKVLHGTFTKVVAGAVAEVATAEVAFAGAGDDIPADADLVQEAVYLLSVNAAGAVAILQGAIVDGAGNAVVPNTPAAEAPLGHVRIAVAAGATPFDSTTDLLSAAHLTVTFTDMGEQLREAQGSVDLSGLTVRATARGR